MEGDYFIWFDLIFFVTKTQNTLYELNTKLSIFECENRAVLSKYGIIPWYLKWNALASNIPVIIWKDLSVTWYGSQGVLWLITDLILSMNHKLFIIKSGFRVTIYYVKVNRFSCRSHKQRKTFDLSEFEKSLIIYEPYVINKENLF